VPTPPTIFPSTSKHIVGGLRVNTSDCFSLWLRIILALPSSRLLGVSQPWEL
jgi:hypothetical protein